MNVLEIGNVKFEALGSRVLIQEDEFKSGYECDSCGGSGKQRCTECGGFGSYVRSGNPIKCSHCSGKGTFTCSACGGKGGVLVVPEVSQRRPTTGKIVSVGPECKALKVGESVMFSNFAGFVVDLSKSGKPIVLRILQEVEIMCRLEGHLDLKNLKANKEVSLVGDI